MDLSTWLDAEPGRNAKLAAHMKRSPAAITQWRTNGVPVDLMKAVRDFTEGAVTLEEMVPDPTPPTQATDAAKTRKPPTDKGGLKLAPTAG